MPAELLTILFLEGRKDEGEDLIEAALTEAYKEVHFSMHFCSLLNSVAESCPVLSFYLVS